MFAMIIHCSVRGTDAFKPQAHIDHGRHNVQNDEEMLDSAHSNPQASSYWDAQETGLSQSAVWHIMHEQHLYSFHTQLAKGQ
jgi:hypothetical protein